MAYFDWIKTRYNKRGFRGIVESVRDGIRYNVVQTDKKWEGMDVSKFYPDSLINLPGYKLKIDQKDKGISQELMINGIREPAAYWHYRNIIRSLDSPTVFEAGANIGYYALAAAVDAPKGKIICAELDENNIEILKTNIRINEQDHRVSASQAALDEKSRLVERSVDEYSNCHRLNPTDKTTPTETIQTIRTCDFLEEQGFSQQDIDVLRMDVEGSELRVLRGIPNINPKAAHIEVHQPALTSSEWHELVAIIKSWPCDLLGVYKEDREYNAKNIEEIPSNKSVELVFG